MRLLSAAIEGSTYPCRVGGFRRLRLLAAVTALACVAGCGGGGDDPEAAAPSTTPANGTPSSSDPTAVATLDPAHAVDQPGRRSGQIAPADIIVNGSQSLSPEVIDRIRKLEHVTDVEPLSFAQVVIENQALRVAAVDPATYRNYAPLDTAQAQVVWDRVAAGEVAIRKSLKKKLPQDDNGFVRLGTSEDAATVHIGAFAPQAIQVDAVVNESWVPDLDVNKDNALLIRTGGTAPITLRKPIERIVGHDGTVQMVDAVARFGLDPNVQQTAVLVGTVADAVGTFRYSVLGGGRIAPEPAWVATHIATETVPILGNVTCNKLLFPQLKAALAEIQSSGLASKIHPGEYAGCYYPRFIAGTTTLSNHSFGLALDLNVPGNQRGTAGEMDRTVVSIFKKWGFAWGGDWRYTDPMHFEMEKLVAPR
jgi:hypothetical protein